MVHFAFPAGTSANYLVLETDYVNYSAVFSCYSVLDLFHFEFAWVLVRDVNVDAEIVAKAKEAFTRNGLDISTIEVCEHNNCVYDPPDVSPCN